MKLGSEYRQYHTSVVDNPVYKVLVWLIRRAPTWEQTRWFMQLQYRLHFAWMRWDKFSRSWHMKLSEVEGRQNIALFAEEIEEAVMQFLVKEHGLSYDSLSNCRMLIEGCVCGDKTSTKFCTFIVQDYVNTEREK